MSNIKHTPLPWNKPLKPTYSEMFNVWYCLIRDAKENINQKIYGNTKEEAEANAKLIVKAVNCHDDLVGLAEQFKVVMSGKEKSPIYKQILLTLEKAKK